MTNQKPLPKSTKEALREFRALLRHVFETFLFATKLTRDEPEPPTTVSISYPRTHRNDRIVFIGQENGWRLKKFVPHTGTMVFVPVDTKSPYKNLVVYTTKMTVSTAMKHPYKGDTQLYRKNVSLMQLEQLFINPRKHTGKGYYTTKQ